jgi:hypothetical protein
MDLYHHALFPCVSIPNLGYSIAWSTNFQEDFPLDVGLRWSNHQLRVFGIAGSAAGQIGLMFLALSMG